MKVFRCQHCDKPFQATPEMAGQQVQCPSCERAVEIPSDAFSDGRLDAPSPGKQRPAKTKPPTPTNTMFACPRCDGKFQVPADFLQIAREQQIAPAVECPHCQSSVEVTESVPPETRAASASSGRSTEVKRRTDDGESSSRKRKKQSGNADLFAPGFKGSGPKNDAVKPKDPKPSKGADETNQPKTRGTSDKQSKTGEPKSKLDAPSPSRKSTSNSSSPVEVGSTAAKPLPKKKPGQPQQPPGPAGTEPTKKASKPETDQSKPGKQRPTKSKPSTSKATQPEPTINVQVADSPQTTEVQLQSIDHLLPPKFLVDDPERLAVSVSRENHKVLLPDGEGGMAQVDDRIVRVQVGDKKVTLLKLTPEQKARRRFISNLLTILLAIACMALAFWILQ